MVASFNDLSMIQYDDGIAVSDGKYGRKYLPYDITGTGKTDAV